MPRGVPPTTAIRFPTVFTRHASGPVGTSPFVVANAVCPTKIASAGALLSETTGSVTPLILRTYSRISFAALCSVTAEPPASTIA